MRQRMILRQRQRQSTRLSIKGKTLWIAGTSSIVVAAFAAFMIYGNFGTNGSANADAGKALPEIIAFGDKANPSSKFIRCNGWAKEFKVILSWAAVTEINNDYFTIEKSADGIKFEEYGTMEGTGNTSSIQDFSYDDFHPANGKNYYRLKHVSPNGEVEYSKIIFVTFNSHTEKIEITNIRPTPFAEEFTVDFNMQEGGECNILILDELGNILVQQVVASFRGYNNFHFAQTENLESGIYYLKIFKNAVSSKSVKIEKRQLSF